MIVAELRARLTLLDINDNFVAYLGDNEAICTNDGWPNSKDASGEIVPTGLHAREILQSSRHRSGP